MASESWLRSYVVFKAPEGVSTEDSQYGWTRGFAASATEIFVGFAPVNIVKLDRNKVLETEHPLGIDDISVVRLSDHPDESIFDIALDRTRWSLQRMRQSLQGINYDFDESTLSC